MTFVFMGEMIDRLVFHERWLYLDWSYFNRKVKGFRRSEKNIIGEIDHKGLSKTITIPRYFMTSAKYP